MGSMEGNGNLPLGLCLHYLQADCLDIRISSSLVNQVWGCIIRTQHRGMVYARCGSLKGWIVVLYAYLFRYWFLSVMAYCCSLYRQKLGQLRIDYVVITFTVDCARVLFGLRDV